MSAEVKTLPVKHREAFPPREDIIKEAEAILAMAKEGKIQAFAWALVYADDLSLAGEVTNGWIAESGTRFGMGYAISELGWRFHARQNLAT